MHRDKDMQKLSTELHDEGEDEVLFVDEDEVEDADEDELDDYETFDPDEDKT